MDNDFFELLHLDCDMSHFSEESKIKHKRLLKSNMYNARKELIGMKCFYCGKSIASCNSHFVPKSYLQNIASNGEVFLANRAIKFEGLEDRAGLNSAGTFHLICRNCDNTIFKDYENFDYKTKPTTRILAQIALKNYLKFIDKRLFEKSLIYNSIKNRVPYHVYDSFLEVKNIDIEDYKKDISKIKRFLEGHGNKEYTIVFLKRLDYVVPLASQTCVALTHDFKGNIINNVYSMSKHNNVESIHICIFPLRESSVVIMFYDNKSKKYRGFRRQFNNFNDEEKLAIIFYILVKQSEDIFYSKNIPSEIFDHQEFIEAAQSNCVGVSNIEDEYSRHIKAMEKINEDFDLNNFNSIPNLLSEKYKIR